MGCVVSSCSNKVYVDIRPSITQGVISKLYCRCAEGLYRTACELWTELSADSAAEIDLTLPQNSRELVRCLFAIGALQLSIINRSRTGVELTPGKYVTAANCPQEYSQLLTNFAAWKESYVATLSDNVAREIIACLIAVSKRAPTSPGSEAKYSAAIAGLVELASGFEASPGGEPIRTQLLQRLHILHTQNTTGDSTPTSSGALLSPFPGDELQLTVNQVDVVLSDAATEPVPKQSPNASPRGRASPRNKTLLPMQEGLIHWKNSGTVIGQGSFGRVFMGMNTRTGALIAIKAIDCSKKQIAMSTIEREVNIMKKLQHEHIVQYYGTATKGTAKRKQLYILMEYVPGGSLEALLRKFGTFSEAVVHVYTGQILHGLEYLHAHNILHRDIKASNILVNQQGVIKLSDFGTSLTLDGSQTIKRELVGTPLYMAPETIREAKYSRASDVWALACTIIQMLTGKQPWWEQNFESVEQALYYISRATASPEIPQISHALRHLLESCFSMDPAERPLCDALLQHTWVVQSTDAIAMEEPDDTPLLCGSVTESNASSVLRRVNSTVSESLTETSAIAPTIPTRKASAGRLASLLPPFASAIDGSLAATGHSLLAPHLEYLRQSQ
eukprot:TRINITY_DN6208_c0_g1_i1.p1 TRINITY_DN6208_c0_g1~~TRINITY_DN6208_c0_g1_i1.p1  ORF type:complete len:617 (+),score=67.14 TRINITY_DN6208_c0_g1_i1:26-1876(+)